MFFTKDELIRARQLFAAQSQHINSQMKAILDRIDKVLEKQKRAQKRDRTRLK